MGRIVANFFISLDGVVEDPHEWHFPYFDDEMGRIVGEGMQSATAFLLGRRLYDEWSEYWSGEGKDNEFAPFITDIPKYVLTRRPIGGEPWAGTTVLGDDAVAQVRALKERIDGEIQMSGCATTVRWLLAEGLLDELALLVHPIVVGKGQRLFEDTGTVPLTLRASATLPTGVLHVRYGESSS